MLKINTSKGGEGKYICQLAQLPWQGYSHEDKQYMV